jgi:hypothetical protein
MKWLLAVLRGMAKTTPDITNTSRCWEIHDGTRAIKHMQSFQTSKILVVSLPSYSVGLWCMCRQWLTVYIDFIVDFKGTA